MRKIVLIFGFVYSITFTFGQDPIVVVDGYFLNMKKSEAINYIGFDNIKDTAYVESDSAISLIGEYGENGLFIIKTNDPRGQLSSSLRSSDKLFFEVNPAIYINDSLMIGFDLGTIYPSKVDSIIIITPLTSVQEKGFEWIGGEIKIYMRE